MGHYQFNGKNNLILNIIKNIQKLKQNLTKIK